MIQVDNLLSKLEGVRAFGGDRWLAKCPAHEDRSPSLSIKLVNDRLLVHCFTGCGPDDVLGAVGMKWSDLFADRWEAAQVAQVAHGHKRRHKLLSEISQRDYATWVVHLAAADKARGIRHDLEDRATLAMAVHILKGDRQHG